MADLSSSGERGQIRPIVENVRGSASEIKKKTKDEGRKERKCHGPKEKIDSGSTEGK